MRSTHLRSDSSRLALHAGLAVAWAALAACPAAAQTRPASAPASAPATMPAGQVITLPGGMLFIPAAALPLGRSVDLLVHFHGHPPTVARNFIEAGVHGALIVVNYPGLSAAYAGPFRDPQRLEALLRDGLRELRDRKLAPPDAEWRRICISSFSAGYGAVREILKTPRYFERIDGILLADSLYAAYVDASGDHRLLEEHMRDFRRFAAAAAVGTKTLIITHSYLVPGTYASTIETADDLIGHVGAQRVSVSEAGPDGMRIISRADKGRFHVFGCAGTDGAAHMQHLRNMAFGIRDLPLEKLTTARRNP